MVSKPSLSIFNRIFSSKKQSDGLIASGDVADLNPADEMVIDREFATTIQPPRLRRLEEARSAQIQAYRDSLNVPLESPIARPQHFGAVSDDDVETVETNFSGGELEIGRASCRERVLNLV